MQVNELLRISDEAIDFINKYIKPIVTPDYIGWSIPLPKKYKSVMIIDYSINNNWDLLPINPAKRLKKRTIVKALKFLISKGWLTPLVEVFEEFSPQLKVDMENAIIIPQEKYNLDDKIVDFFPELDYDDNVDDIIVEQEENKN